MRGFESLRRYIISHASTRVQALKRDRRNSSIYTHDGLSPCIFSVVWILLEIESRTKQKNQIQTRASNVLRKYNDRSYSASYPRVLFPRDSHGSDSRVFLSSSFVRARELVVLRNRSGKLVQRSHEMVTLLRRRRRSVTTTTTIDEEMNGKERETRRTIELRYRRDDPIIVLRASCGSLVYIHIYRGIQGAFTRREKKAGSTVGIGKIGNRAIV